MQQRTITMTTAQRIESLETETESLVLQRQALRERRASPAELEHNRLRIVSVQQALSRAYIEWKTPAHVPRQSSNARTDEPALLT